MFKVGDVVKAFVKLGLQKEKSWHKGTVSSIEETTHSIFIVVKFANGVEQDVGSEPKGNVQLFRELSEAALSEFVDKELENLYQMTKAAIKHFYGDKYKVECGCDTINIANIISISPTAVEQKSILGVTEYPGWECITYKHLPATYWEPEDCQEIGCATSRSTHQIVQMALENFHKLVEIIPYFDQLADEAYAKQLAEEKEYN